ncbi:hypothetical protein C8R44DRAFT_938338 [Mycena epipterygia]|nr:hypothetical protein C8R44DRAFT_938338 [Mycena epipterygia]
MDSIHDLRSRIDDVSLAIIRQLEVLSDLENTKGDLQSHLNAILDPMARLPVEISSDIFIRTCLHKSPYPAPTLSPQVLLQICRSWRKIALATPSLWATISIRRKEDSLENVRLRFARAPTAQLSISLSGDIGYARHAVVHENAHRIRILKLHYLPFDAFGDMKIVFPSLKSLTLTPVEADQNSYSLHRDDERLGVVRCVVMMCAAPGLEECTFDKVMFSGSKHPASLSRHTSLRQLRLHSADILRSLELPALESLGISYFNITRDEFLDFLTRSSAPLQSLNMVIPARLGWPSRQAEDWSIVQLERLCRLVPLLTDFTITKSPPSFPIVELLASRSPQQQLLPNLRKLTLRSFTPEDSQYKMAVRMLYSRRSQLQMFRLVLSGNMDPPETEIIAALRELVADGMEIHVGTRVDNWV